MERECPGRKGVVEWKKQKWVCSSNGRVIPSQGIGNGIDARLIQSFLFHQTRHSLHLLQGVENPLSLVGKVGVRYG